MPHFPPLAQSSFNPEFKLGELLGSAGATVGIIVFGTIFLQFISSKFTELANRYRGLAGEYRNGEAGQTRHDLLQQQIRNYRLRLNLLLLTSLIAGVAVLCFLSSVLMGGASMLLPETPAFTIVGATALFCGLVLIGFAVALEIYESMLARFELRDEVGDLDDPAKKRPF